MSESIFTDDGAIRPAALIAAYRTGMFPMSLSRWGEIGWFSPDPRGVLPLEEFHIPHGLKRAVKKKPFDIRFSTAFGEVMDGCADRTSTWISPEIRASYVRLFELGYGHSVECWQGDELCGGLYGVAIGGVFFGESMFSRKTDASKIALVALVERMKSRGFTLLDTQWTTSHLLQFGCVEVPRHQYMRELNAALLKDPTFL